jgi:hypothetical protein
MDILSSLTYLWGGRLPDGEARVDLFSEISLRYAFLQNSGAVLLQAWSPLDRVEEALKVAPERLSQWETLLIRREDLLAATVLSITEHYAGQQDGQSYLLDIASDILGGEKPGFQDEYLSTIKGVQLDEVRSLGRRTFNVMKSAAPPEGGSSPEQP